MPGSGKTDNFTCDCGKSMNMRIASVFSGKTKSCGRCSEVSKEIIATTKFGHLKQTTPKETMPGSGKTDNFTCDCGKNINVPVFSVFNGKISSCGSCSFKVKQWYQNNEMEIKKTKTPIEPGHFYGCPIVFLETMTNTGKSVLAICPACKNEYKPMWDNIRHGKSLTCGCCAHKISRPAIQIADFIQFLGFKTEFEHKIRYKARKMSFDIFVHDKNLLIEYDGSRFHETEEKKAKDFQKCLNAISLGFDCLRIQEADWKKENREKTKKQLMNLLGVRSSAAYDLF
jgi:very-short-patch-repair endonuclease